MYQANTVLVLREAAVSAMHVSATRIEEISARLTGHLVGCFHPSHVSEVSVFSSGRPDFSIEIVYSGDSPVDICSIDDGSKKPICRLWNSFHVRCLGDHWSSASKLLQVVARGLEIAIVRNWLYVHLS